jgi:hypothetical protein
MQVASPLVYRLAKHVVATSVRAPGAPIWRRVRERPLYEAVQTKVAAFLDLQPQTECLAL